MIRAVPFTQASVRRAIAAAQKAGLQVTAIRPDGTILVTKVLPHSPKRQLILKSELVLSILAMPRPRPPHLVREVTRHGKVVWYVRRGANGTRGARIRLRAQLGTSQFLAEYQAAIAQKRPVDASSVKGPPPGTLAWLIARYRETTLWQSLSAATRRQRENFFLQAIKSAGDEPLGRITQATIIAGRDRRAANTPAQARNFLDSMRGLFRWAYEAGHVASDPTAGVRRIQGAKTAPDFGRGQRMMWLPTSDAGPWNTATGLVGCFALHRVEARRCRAG